MLGETMRRPVAVVLLLTFGVWAGCAGGGRTLSKQELEDPPAADSYVVTTTDGGTVTFISLHVDGDWLIGTARFTTTEEEGEGEDVTTSVANVYEEVRIPWAQVVSVEALGGKQKSDTGFLLAGAAIVVGVVVFVLLVGGEPMSRRMMEESHCREQQRGAGRGDERGDNANMGSNTVTLGDSDFSTTVESSPIPVMADFWAPWCQPCLLIEPFVDELAGDFAGRLTVAKVNIDENPGVAAQYNIRAIPTLLFFRNGQVVDSLQAAVPKAQLQKKIEDVLAG